MPFSNQTPSYNLKAVVQETGLKPDTLRAWERRYGLPQPQRTAGGHRLYSQHDIDMLKWLSARQHEGLSISRAVDLWHSLREEGKDPLETTTSQASEPLTLQPPVTVGNAVTELRRAWIAACLAFDERIAENVLTQASALYPLETVGFELLQKGLSEMGEAWYNGTLTVQQEHFASALAIRRLDTWIAATPPPSRPGRVLIGCPPQEEHTFSPLLMTLLLRRRGWEVVYLGADVPITRLEVTIATARPQLVVLPAQQLHSAASLLEMAQLVDQERVALAYGGTIFNLLPALRSRIPGHFMGERLETAPLVVEQFLMSLRSGWPPPPVIPVDKAHQQALAHFRANQAQIEAHVWQLLKDTDIPHPRLANANIKFSQNIIAALSLGDIEFAGTNISWIEGLFINYRLPMRQLRAYLNAYQQAMQTHLGEQGQILSNWLKQLTLQETRS